MLGARRSRPSRHARVARAFLTAAVLGLVFGAFSQAAGAKVIWLCKPGQQPDPCTPGLSTTVFSPQLKPGRVEHPKQVKKPAIDCFYVYPTVSTESGPNADLQVQSNERLAAQAQA